MSDRSSFARLPSRLKHLTPLAAASCCLVLTASMAAAQSAAPTPAPAGSATALPPHVHGSGKLDIAIEGNVVQMELEAPAADIIGFEHAPRSEAERKMLASARATLAKPLAVIAPPADAGCKVTSAKVVFTAGDDHDDHSHGKAKPADAAKAGAADDHDDGHSEFHATYALTCSRIAALRTLDFPYFKAFKGAEKLTVTLIAPKGQSQFDVARDKPSLDLGGMM